MNDKQFLFREKDDDYWDAKSRYLNLNYGESQKKKSFLKNEKEDEYPKVYNDYNETINYDEEFVFNEDTELENQNEELIEVD